MKSPADFSRQLYEEAKQLFPEGTIQTFVTRPAVAQPGQLDPAVKLLHSSSGIEASCNDFPSQIENYIVAIIRLKIACDHRGK